MGVHMIKCEKEGCTFIGHGKKHLRDHKKEKHAY